MIRNYRFWLCLLAVLALLVLARWVVAAQDRAIKPGPVRVIEMTITPSTDMGRQLTKCPVVAKIQIIDHLPSGEVRVIGSDVVHFDLVAVAGQSVLVSGSVRTYREIAESLYAAILQEHENGPGPLPGRKTVEQPKKAGGSVAAGGFFTGDYVEKSKVRREP